MTPEDVIRHHVVLPTRTNSSGWYPVLCKVCNDHGNKGPRAAFRFDEGGTVVGYHCFNCGHAASYDSDTGRMPSRNFTILLRSFQIPTEQFKAWSFMSMKLGLSAKQAYVKEIREKEPKAVSLLKPFYELSDNPKDIVGQAAIRYLTERGIDWTSQPFYLCKETKTALDRWFGRIIIPVYKDSTLIYYTGRDLTGLHARKYLNSGSERSAVMYGYDNIFNSSRTDPIFITEGWFDAKVIDGVCVFGREITDEQKFWLNRTDRQKIVIPDKGRPGYDLAMCAIENGWDISLPDIGQSDDINSAVNRYGVLYTQKSIIDSITSGQQAKLKAKLYCNIL